MAPPNLSVSVVICCFSSQRLELLTQAIGAAHSQLGDHDELVVVVDHNPDLAENLAAFAAEFMADRDDSRLHLVASSGPKGLSGARNTGIDSSSGDIIVFLDDDALPRPGWLAAIREAFRTQDLAVLAGAVMPRWSNGKPGWFPDEFGWVVGCDYRGMAPDGQDIRNPIGANMAIRRSALADVRFESRLGRDAKKPLGAEETGLAIALRQRDPSVTIRRITRAAVDHHVSAERCTISYVLKRCWYEGISKKLLVSSVGASDGLAAERRHLVAIPLAAARHLLALTRGDLSAPVRAAMVLIATFVTGLGYLLGRAPRHSSFAPIPVVECTPENLDTLDETHGANSNGEAFFHCRERGWTILGDVETGLADTGEMSTRAKKLFAQHNHVVPQAWPIDNDPQLSVTIAICTLGRADSLHRAVTAALGQGYERLEVLVIDNDPASGATERQLAGIVDDRLRIVGEHRKGLSWARNRAIDEASGDILAFTDDDCVADPQWILAIASLFSATGNSVSCVTGLVLPEVLDSQEQLWFEQSAGFGKGFTAQWWPGHGQSPQETPITGLPWLEPGHRGVAFPYTGSDFGSGNNMAFRIDVLRAIGGFDTALGAGTVARGGEDLDIFRRVHDSGHGIAYLPAALVTHVHRADRQALETQLFGYGSGLSAMLSKQLLRGQFGLLRVIPRGLNYLIRSDSAKNAAKDRDFPRSLAAVEWRGLLAGPVLYLKAQRHARTVARTP